MVSNIQPRVMGYSRVSLDEQAVGIKAQNEAIEKMAVEIAQKHGAMWQGAVLEEVDSARKVRYFDRPVFASLLSTLRSKDHLVVYKLDRLERNQRYMIELGYRLADMGVTLHIVCGLGGQRMDLDTMVGRLIFSIFAWFSELEVENIRERTRNAMQWRKANGFAYCPTRLGFTTVPLALKPGQDKPLKQVVPDPGDMRTLFRIVFLIDRCGWLLRDVATALYKEGAKTSKGKPWTRESPIQKARGRHPLRVNTISMIYRRFKANPEAFFDRDLFCRLYTTSEIEAGGKKVRAIVQPKDLPAHLKLLTVP